MEALTKDRSKYVEFNHNRFKICKLTNKIINRPEVKQLSNVYNKRVSYRTDEGIISYPFGF